jgi:DNA-3-methyladenine glycosylase
MKSDRLTRDFFERDPILCARELIGCTLGMGECSGVIVETEAYTAENDPACHTWKRSSAREFVARHAPGTAYVYLNYGMHWLCNFLVKGGAREGFVLIRALEPMQGIDAMRHRRSRVKLEELCNGPAKLTQALGITGEHHGVDPFSVPEWHLSFGEVVGSRILVSTRIGISQATEYPWRFLLKGSRCVSVPI